MKIRNGFVSNSSSSSFVLVGKEVCPQEIDPSKLNQYKVIGTYLDEGLDVFDISHDVYKIMKDNGFRLKGMRIYLVDFYTAGEDFLLTKDIVLKKDSHMLCDQKDMHGGFYVKDSDWGNSLDDFRKRYIEIL